MILDNHDLFFKVLKAAIDHADPEAKLDIKKASSGWMLTITPHNKDFRQDTINNTLYISRIFKLPIRFSSSLAISERISFLLEETPDLN